MNWLRRLVGRSPVTHHSVPPKRAPDPDIAENRKLTDKALLKTRLTIQKRHRLNAELQHAEKVLRANYR